MYEGSIGSKISVLDKLNKVITTSLYKVKESKRSQGERESTETELKNNRHKQKLINNTLEYCKDKKKALVDFNAEKKKTALGEIYSGIYQTRSIIPDSNPVKLVITREEAVLVNDKGHSVQATEGSAFRAIMSLFTRGIVLKNTQYIKTMLLDEPVTALSPETSAMFSKYLPVLAKNMQIILIEQKNEIFDNAESVVFDFKKTEGQTYVRRLE